MSKRTLSGSESQLTLSSPLLPIPTDGRTSTPGPTHFPTGGSSHTRLLNDSTSPQPRKGTAGGGHTKKLPSNVPPTLVMHVQLQQFRREHLGSVKAIVDQYSLAGLECCGTVPKASQFISDSGATRTALVNFAAECFLLASFYEQCLRSNSPDSARFRRSMPNSPSQSYSQPPSRTGSAKDLVAERERAQAQGAPATTRTGGSNAPPGDSPKARREHAAPVRKKVSEDLTLILPNVLLRPGDDRLVPSVSSGSEQEEFPLGGRPFHTGQRADSVGEMLESDSHMGSEKGSDRGSPDQTVAPPPPSDCAKGPGRLAPSATDALKALKSFFPRYRLLDSSSLEEIETNIDSRPCAEHKRMILDLLQVVGRILPGLGFSFGQKSSSTLDSEFSAPGTPVPHQLQTRVPSMSNLPLPQLTHNFEEGEDAAGFPMINGYTIVDRAGKGSYGTVIIAVTQAGEQRAIKQVRKARLRQKWANVLHKEEGYQDHAPLAIPPAKESVTPPELPENDAQPSTARNRQALTALHHEIAVMKKIRHQNVVPLIEVIDDPQEDMLYLVMPYIERGPLLQLTPQGTCAPLDVDVVRGYMRQLLEGLQYLHERHIVHRDIKPDNILLGADGKVYLADFGVSHMFDPDAEEVVESCEGTLAFMAPECFSDVRIAAKPVDVWALGVTFYVMLFGHLPFEGSTHAEVREAITSGAVLFPPIEAFAKDIQGDYHAAIHLVSKMLSKSPDDRISVHRSRKHPFISRLQQHQHLARSKTAGVGGPPPAEASARGSSAGESTPTGKPPRPKARSPSRQRFPPWSVFQASTVQSTETLAQSSDSGDEATVREPSTLNFTASFFTSSTIESGSKEPGSPFSFGEASQNSCLTDSQRKSIDVQVTADEEREAMVTRGPIRSASSHAIDVMIAEGVVPQPAGLPAKPEPPTWKYTRRRLSLEPSQTEGSQQPPNPSAIC